MSTRRLNVTIEERLIDQAIRLTGARTQREAVEIALRELVRRRNLDRMSARAGTIPLATTVGDLLDERGQC